MKQFYPVAIIGPINENDGYSAIFPDVPGCVSAGHDLTDAFTNACEALTEHFGILAEDGESIPPPSALDQAKVTLEADTQPGDGPIAALLLVPVEMPGKAQRFNVTLDENLVARIDAITNNRSAFLADAARAELRRRL